MEEILLSSWLYYQLTIWNVWTYGNVAGYIDKAILKELLPPGIYLQPSIGEKAGGGVALFYKKYEHKNADEQEQIVTLHPQVPYVIILRTWKERLCEKKYRKSKQRKTDSKELFDCPKVWWDSMETMIHHHIYVENNSPIDLFLTKISDIRTTVLYRSIYDQLGY